ncbi:MAG: hypothetical protein AB1649_17870 [Chloroflexota bacterium]
MNRITDRMKIGTVGELLVQLRLLEHDIQAAPPIKDSGNDLIAVKGNTFKAIQVKTVTGSSYSKPAPGREYHILAVVHLHGDEDKVLLDESPVFMIPRAQVDALSIQISELEAFRISAAHLNSLFS